MKARRFYEQNRDSWLPDHAGKIAIIRLGELIGIFEKVETPDSCGFQDHKYQFIIMSRESEERALLASRWDRFSFWESLGEPFLDTEDPVGSHKADQLLRVHGYSRLEIFLWRRIAGTGLWWNVIWWEWVSLGLPDFTRGWSNNCFLMAIVIMPLLSGALEVPSILAISLPLLYAGVRLRSLGRRQLEEESKLMEADSIEYLEDNPEVEVELQSDKRIQSPDM